MVKHFTIADSVFDEDMFAAAFDDTGETERTYIVDAGAFLSAVGSLSDGMRFSTTDAIALTVNGSVFGSDYGIHLLGGDATVSIGRDAEVGGYKAIEASTGLGAYHVTNLGLASGHIDLGADGDTVRNGGTVVGYIATRQGNDTVWDFARIGHRTVSGTINGSVDLGSGDDRFFGGRNGEHVYDGDGSDTIRFGGGDDTYGAFGAPFVDGKDKVDGGSGIDLYDASDAHAAVYINLDGAKHREPQGIDFLDLNNGTTFAANAAVGSVGADTIAGFEWAAGGDYADIVFGSKSVNRLEGNKGADDLFGLAGNDELLGGDGKDNLVGGAGRDALAGGDDQDRFWFFALSDSGPTRSTRDTIADFEANDGAGDLIDLSQLDADTASKGHQVFTFLGLNQPGPAGAFTDVGQLRAYWTDTGTMIEANVKGDLRPDFSIFLAGHIDLTVDDFIGVLHP